MNEYLIATGKPLIHTIADGQVTIQQIKVEDIHSLFFALQMREKLNNDFGLEKANEVLLSDGELCMLLCFAVTDIDITKFQEILLKDKQWIVELLSKIFTLNEAFFKHEKPKTQPKVKQDESTWFDALQSLISMGHQHSEIMQMSYGAFAGYLKSCQKYKNMDLLSHLNVVRLAQHGDKKAIDSFVKSVKAV